MGKTPGEWSYGDLDAAFKNASSFGRNICHTRHPVTRPLRPEPHGLLAERQSPCLYGDAEHFADGPGDREVVEHRSEHVVLISEYNRGGFGSKVTAGVTLIIPALLAKKVNAPVMMRSAAEEETFIGRRAAESPGQMKVGFSKEGRVLGLDMFVISNNGPYDANGDVPSSGRIVSLLYQCQAMRWRGATIRRIRRRAARRVRQAECRHRNHGTGHWRKRRGDLGWIKWPFRRINCPEGKAPVGPVTRSDGKRPHATSAFLKEALDRGAEQFKWNERVARTPKQSGTKVRGVGVSLSCYVGGTDRFRWAGHQPEGRIRFQSGVGNLGTESVMDVHRAGAEILGVPWEKWNHLGRHGEEFAFHVCLRWQPDNTRDDASRSCNGNGGEERLQEIAAKSLVASRKITKVANERVFRKGGGASMTWRRLRRKRFN